MQKIILEKKDVHGTWRIKESKKYKILEFENSTYSIINKKGIFAYGYWDFFLPLAEFYEKPSVLMIGLGGGTLVYQIRNIVKDGADIDIVEISSVDIEISKLYLPQLANEKIYHENGIDFVSKCDKKYDLVILDAYLFLDIPPEFLESEFVKNVSRVTKENAIFAINYAQTFSGIMHFKEFVKILKSVFSVYLVNAYFTDLNSIIICVKNIDKEKIIEKLEKSNIRYPWTIKYRYKNLKTL
ncbi:MAG: spermidine synthase [Thermoplasmata archaeon]